MATLKMNQHIMWHQVVYSSACTNFYLFQTEKTDGQVSDAQTTKDQHILALNI